MLQLIDDTDLLVTTTDRIDLDGDAMLDSLESATTVSPRSLLQAIEPLLAQAGSFGPAPCAAPLVQRRLRAWHGAAALQSSCLTMLCDAAADDGLSSPDLDVSPFGVELGPDLW